jgi:hypothetical protein
MLEFAEPKQQLLVDDAIATEGASLDLAMLAQINVQI